MYLTWDEKTITDCSEKNINSLYESGYLFTREGKGKMYQTRSLRIDLNKFELSSENRRVLKKTEGLNLSVAALPYPDYIWSIGKLGKDFYETKFGLKTFSANKIKELLTDEIKSNFNRLLIYSLNNNPIGYCVCIETDKILHYCYPFYNLDSKISSLGLGMMTEAVVWAKKNNKRYIYLGSAQRPTDTYKLQFEGLEWFDSQTWQTDLEVLKNILKT